jgi:adenylate cyclase
VERKLAAILAADVAGYSRLMGADEVGTLDALKAHLSELVLPRIAEHGGRVVKTTGDGLLAEFASVVAAVQCALVVQRGMIDRNAAVPTDRRLEFRIGINLGDVVVEGDDLFGDGVNVAARVESMARPGGICLSRAARDQVRDKLPVQFEDVGEQILKNIARPVRLFHLVDAPAAAGTKIGGRPAARGPSPRWLALFAAAAAILAVAGAIVWMAPWQLARTPPPSAPAAIVVPGKTSIAVLPFANMSGEKEQDYFADGLTEDLIAQLSRISKLFVIARSSVLPYKGAPAKPQEVGRSLGVRYILNGSVRKSGTRLRISAQLVDTESAQELWANQYDREMSDIFALQDEVIGRIVAALAVKLTDFERKQIARIPTGNLEAYDYYLRAETEGYYNTDFDSTGRALALYAKAIQLDPNFAEAQAGYARAAVEIFRLGNDYLMPVAMARKRAYEAAGRALSLDPGNARAYTVLAILQLGDRRHADAIESARKAVDLNPSDAEARANLGVILAYSGQPTEALTATEQALQLNPAPPVGFQWLAGMVFFDTRQYNRAIETLESVTKAWPSAEGAHVYLAAAYAQVGRLEAAQREVAAIGNVPYANLANYRLLYDYYKRDEDLQHFLDGLKAAGVPEWPFGFAGRPQDRVTGVALRELVLGRTWMGRTMVKPQVGMPFMQQVDSEGRVAYRGTSSFLTGTAQVEDDEVCMRFDGYFRDRWQCGYVYRNDAAATGGAKEDYIYVSPDGLRYFSPKA